MRFYFLFALVFALPLLNGCSKKGDDNPAAVVGIAGGVVSIPAGTYAVVGTVNVNPNCGIPTATITLSSGNYIGGPVIGTATVGTGGSFNFPVPATAVGAYPYNTGSTYYLSATAGQCSVAGSVGALTNGQPAYTVCLGLQGVCGGQYGYGRTYKISSKAEGSIESEYSGNGDFSFDSAQIHLSAKKASAFSLSLQYTNGNNLLSVSPGITDGAWKGTVNADGSLKVGEASVTSLSYGSQVDANLLRFNQSFCGTPAAAIEKMSEYAQSSGFSAKAIDAMKASWSSKAISSGVCVYPQDTATIDSVVAVKGDNIVANRIWFALVPTGEIAGKKFVPSDKIAKLTSKAKVGKLVAAKKVPSTRKVASDNEILAEELGFGFLIQK